MNTTSKKHEPVSKLYARALFELAQEQSIGEEIQRDLTGFVEMWREQADLREALSSYLFSTQERQKLVESLASTMQANVVFARFLQLLAAKNRTGLIESIYEEYSALIDQAKGILRGSVTTVEPLTDAERADLSAAFERKFGKQVVLESKVDKEILGGLIVKVKGMTFDGSLRTTIRRLRENLERQSI